MKKLYVYTTILGLGSSLVLLGSGCSVANLIRPAMVLNNSPETPVLSETQYYNKVIQVLNTTLDQTVQIQNTYRNFAATTTVKSRSQIFTTVDTTVYDMAKQNLMNDILVMQNADAQDAVEVQLENYFDQYHNLIESNNAVAEYYQRGQYKDDDEAKKDNLLNRFTEDLQKTITLQATVLDIIEQYQNQVDLGIDANTTDPLELVTLTQDTLTKDAEQLFKDYQIWIKAYSQDSSAADVFTVQTDFDTLSADYVTYQQRAKDINLAAKTDQAINTAFQDYLIAVNEYSITFENVLRDGKNKTITDVTTVDNEIVELYNSLIDTHNTLVNQVQAQAK